MKVVFYSLILNNHQANVADELWKRTNHQYCFVELANLQAEHRKGATEDYSTRPYLLCAWKGKEERKKAMELAKTADVCVFSGILALPFLKERMKLGKLSFDMSERWLKRGIINLFSPAIFKMWLAYRLGGWNKKPLYKLCCSAFATADQYRLGTFKDKCYKWGYFTKVEKIDVEASSDVSTSNITPLMWCSRYLMWKHPELPVLMAERLKKKGYRFVLDMYGTGEYEEMTKQLVEKLGLTEVVRFHGNKPNDVLMADMRNHDIFLFTSDRNEGWGAVANESMGNGCALVASDAIGAVPYLINDGVDGCTFRAPSLASGFEHPDLASLDSLCSRVEWLLQNPVCLVNIRQAARQKIWQIWSPGHAASCLLQLISDLQNNRDSSLTEGPCSKA